MNITLKVIAEKYLRSNCYEGLVNPGVCGCEVDDLMPCCEPTPDCKPAMKFTPKNDDERCDLCDGKCSYCFKAVES